MSVTPSKAKKSVSYKSSNKKIATVSKKGYKYYTNVNVSCEVVCDFLNWFKQSTYESQKIILSNIIVKLSLIEIEYDFSELPFS